MGVKSMANEKKIEYVLLGLLSHESLTGYEIKKRFETRLKFFWNASYGSIYPTLAKLERDGCVIKKETTENGRQKIVYTITNDGRELLKEWLKRSVIKDELRYETLLKLFFGSEVGPEITINHINEFEDKISSQLEVLKKYVVQLENAPIYEEAHKYFILTIKFGINSYEAYLKWCKEAKEVLGANIKGEK